MIKSIGAAQGGPSPEPAGSVAASPNQEPGNQAPKNHEEIEPATHLEKRRYLAQIIRANLRDCFDASGNFDPARALSTLPACAIQSLVIDETTRTDKQGSPIVHRRITLRLVDKIRAIRQDDLLEEKQEIAGHAEALKTIANLEEALAETDDRELQFSKEMEEKDRQIEALQRAVKLAESRNAASPPSPPLSSPSPQSSSSFPSSKPPSSSKTLSVVEGQAAKPASPSPGPAKPRGPEEQEISCRLMEIEHLKSTSSVSAFSSHYPRWPQEPEARRAYVLNLIKKEAANRPKITDAAPAPPTKRHPRFPP